MNLFTKVLRKFYVTKKRKDVLTELANLIKDVKGVDSEAGVKEGIQKVVQFNKGLDRDDRLKSICVNLFNYLTDTREHVKNGYHKPQHNGWKTIAQYPDINDYVDLGQGTRIPRH